MASPTLAGAARKRKSSKAHIGRNKSKVARRQRYSSRELSSPPDSHRYRSAAKLDATHEYNDRDARTHQNSPECDENRGQGMLPHHNGMKGEFYNCPTLMLL